MGKDHIIRVKFFDCTRALCMLYIIGLWHMQEYLLEHINIVSPITEMITKGVLGTFTFISAYFLGKRPIRRWRDVLDFYKRRLLRLFPLFFISCTSFLAIHYLFHVDFISGIQQYVLTLVGLSVIFPPAPQTVWYVSMIILFYLITPLINYLTEPWKKFLCFLTIMLPLIVLHLTLNLVDNRVLINFPVFFAGLFLSGHLKMTDSPNWKAYIIGIPVFGLGLWLSILFGSISVTLVAVCGFIMLALEIGKLCVYLKFVERILYYISFGSMVAYLFHRQFFGAVEKWLGHFPVAVAYLIILPVLLLISYGVQLLYDKIIDSIQGYISKKWIDLNCIRKN